LSQTISQYSVTGSMKYNHSSIMTGCRDMLYHLRTLCSFIHRQLSFDYNEQHVVLLL